MGQHILRHNKKVKCLKLQLQSTWIYEGTTVALHIYSKFNSLGAVFTIKVLFKVNTFWHAYLAEIYFLQILHINQFPFLCNLSITITNGENCFIAILKVCIITNIIFVIFEVLCVVFASFMSNWLTFFASFFFFAALSLASSCNCLSTTCASSASPVLTCTSFLGFVALAKCWLSFLWMVEIQWHQWLRIITTGSHTFWK